MHLLVGIQVTSVVPLGGDGCTTLGSPVDINRDPKIKTALSGMTHITMVERLSKSQFKDQGDSTYYIHHAMIHNHLLINTLID